MSVRHIHARPGEYIAVHRNRGSVSASRGDTGVSGVGIAVVVLAVVFLWKIILKAILLMCAGVLVAAAAAGVLWLLWKFRRQLWHGIRFAAVAVWRAAEWIVCKPLRAVFGTIRDKFRRRPGGSVT